MRVVLRLFVVLLSILPIHCLAADEIRLARSQLAVLANGLATAPSEQKYTFTRIALAQLYMTYKAEMNHAASDSSSRLKNAKKLNRWRHATNRYLNDIEHALNLIATGSDHDFFVNRQDKVVFSVAGTLLMITGPNYKTESSLETNIFNQFCVLYDCQVYLEKPEANEKREEKVVEYIRPVVNSYWSMDKVHKADLYTDIGIIFRFRDLQNRIAKESWSLDLTRDLLLIIHTLNNIQAKGYSIDFAAVSIEEHSTEDGAVKLTINKKGDFVHVTLPALGRNTGIFPQFLPWLQQYQSNDVANDAEIVVFSEQYYAEG
jgi:hypothetical protein